MAGNVDIIRGFIYQGLMNINLKDIETKHIIVALQIIKRIQTRNVSEKYFQYDINYFKAALRHEIQGDIDDVFERISSVVDLFNPCKRLHYKMNSYQSYNEMVCGFVEHEIKLLEEIERKIPGDFHCEVLKNRVNFAPLLKTNKVTFDELMGLKSNVLIQVIEKNCEFARLLQRGDVTFDQLLSTEINWCTDIIVRS